MARKKLKENRYGGRAKDATLSLPATYPQLFSFTYKSNFLLVLKSSIALSLLALPFLVSLYIRARVVSGITATSSEEEVARNIMSFQGWYGFVILLAFCVFATGLIGALNVYNRHIRNEGVVFLRDFLGGIRKNFGGAFGVTLLYFGVLAVLNFILNTFSFRSDIPYYAMLLVLFIIFSAIVYMAWERAIMIVLVYRCGFAQLIKSSFLMLFSKLPLCLLDLLATAGPFLIAWIIGFAPMVYAVGLAYVAIGFGNGALLISLFNCHIFDETVNKTQFPEAYRKGLFAGGETEEDGGFEG
ncbi:MAG: hypothetical protein K6F32_06050 [Bacilli bacterium]|nr:hypothetical protein [Bacilli bacterium]